MTPKLLAAFAAVMLTPSVVPLANAATTPAHITMHHHVMTQMHHHLTMHHHAHATSKGCKGEFIYMKGGKCMDARNAK